MSKNRIVKAENTKKSARCFVCDSDKVEFRSETKTRNVPYAGRAIYQIEVAKCSDCKAEGDFRRVNDAIVNENQRQALQRSVENMCARLSELGLSNAYVERVFELPQRTIARWKNGEISATSIAFLRIITTYPWIAEVAKHDFEEVHAISQIYIQVGNYLPHITTRLKQIGSADWKGVITPQSSPSANFYFTVNVNMNRAQEAVADRFQLALADNNISYRTGT